MHKVVTINLNGQAYQLDEEAFDALRAYLDRAEAQLRDNPDRAEILADLEQAIADKCLRYLNPHKTVVGAFEIAQVLEEMGPVEGGTSSGAADPKARGGAAGTSEKPRTEPGAPRRLYRIMDGAMIAGVCNGIAAFFGIDVTLIRIVFALLAALELAFSHSGLGLFLYFVMMIVIPGASTSEEQAAARGAPFNAQEVIDRAKRNIGAFKSEDWRHQRREWRRQHREWRRQFQHTMHAERWWGGWGSTTPPASSYGARLVAGLMIPVLAIASLVLLWLFFYAFILLFRIGSTDASLLRGIPLWVVLLALVVAYNAAAWPLHAARRASFHALGAPHYGRYAATDSLMSIGMAALLIWLGYHYVPEVRDFIDHLPQIWENIRDAWSTAR
jgi:phage shock protein PspC (stress-responsive transcriptional regulator)